MTYLEPLCRCFACEHDEIGLSGRQGMLWHWHFCFELLEGCQRAWIWFETEQRQTLSAWDNVRYACACAESAHHMSACDGASDSRHLCVPPLLPIRWEDVPSGSQHV
jgi:hypothetical protein